MHELCSVLQEPDRKRDRKESREKEPALCRNHVHSQVPERGKYSSYLSSRRTKSGSLCRSHSCYHISVREKFSSLPFRLQSSGKSTFICKNRVYSQVLGRERESSLAVLLYQKSSRKNHLSLLILPSVSTSRERESNFSDCFAQTGRIFQETILPS